MEEDYAELFNDEVRTALEDALKDMKGSVDVYVFTDSMDSRCQYCNLTVRLLNFVRDSSPEGPDGKLLKVNVIDRAKDSESFKRFNVERVPTIAFLEGAARWTGSPLGEELRALVETIVRISQGDSGLSQETLSAIRDKLNGWVKIETIVTPTCPYCPYAALMAHMVAYEAYKAGKRNVISDVVEAYENPDIADKYQVMSVPAIAINESVEFIGVPQEDALISSLIERQITK